MRVTSAFLTICALTSVGLTACSRPVAPVQNDKALADTLKMVIADAYDFTKPDIVQRMNSLYSTQGSVVSVSGGQIIANRDSIKLGLESFWKNVGANMRQPHWEWGDVYVDRLGPDAAAFSGTWSIPHIAPTNQPHVIRGAWTAVFLRVGGQWKIVQEHLSSAPSSAGPM